MSQANYCPCRGYCLSSMISTPHTLPSLKEHKQERQHEADAAPCSKSAWQMCRSVAHTQDQQPTTVGVMTAMRASDSKAFSMIGCFNGKTFATDTANHSKQFLRDASHCSHESNCCRLLAIDTVAACCCQMSHMYQQALVPQGSTSMLV